MDVAKHLRRVLRGYRSYAPDHEVLVGHRGELYERLARLLEMEDPAVFDVTARTLAFGDTIVLEAEEREEGITLPLFLDGVQRISFMGGLERSEIDALLDLWWLAIAGRDAHEQNFVTRFWEAELQHVSIVAVETFVQGEERESETTDAGVRQQEHVEAVMHQLSGERLAGGARGDAAQVKVLRVTREDLAVLALDEVAGLDGKLLERYDHAERGRLSGLDETERSGLVSEIVAPPTAIIERLLVAFLDALDLEDGEGFEAVRTLSSRVFQSLARAGAFGPLGEAIRSAMTFARADPADIDRRCRALVPVLEGLQEEQLVHSMVDALDDPRAWEDAASALAFLPPKTVPTLLSRLEALRTPGARAALASLVVGMKPDGETLAGALEEAEPREALEILEMARRIGEDREEVAVSRARQHREAAVRRVAAESLASAPEAHTTELQELLVDADPGIRKIALDALMRVKAKGLVRPLREVLGRPDISPDERRRIVVALGRVGGREASLALQRELKGAETIEERVACIRALGRTRDPSAIAALKAAASGWLTAKEIKVAVEEALERLGRRRP